MGEPDDDPAPTGAGVATEGFEGEKADDRRPSTDLRLLGLPERATGL